MKEQTLARNLAVFGLGLGMAELLAPRYIARCIGVSEDNTRWLQALGLREIGSSLGIMQGKPGPFLWSRVAGDIMDLSLLAAALRSPETERRRVNTAIAAVAGVTILDVIAASLCSRDHSEPSWRVSEPTGYRSGMSTGEPATLRSACDEAMARHPAGHRSAEDQASSDGGESRWATPAAGFGG
jgi:hypothetical protein